MMIKWKEIPGYGKLYKVSNCGDIKSLRRKNTNGGMRKERVLKKAILTTGYVSVTLYKNSKLKRAGVH